MVVGVGAERVAQLSHQRRRRNAAARDVADADVHDPVGPLHDVVPVAADLEARAACLVAARGIDAGDPGELRQQAALERDGDAMLLLVALTARASALAQGAALGPGAGEDPGEQREADERRPGDQRSSITRLRRASPKISERERSRMTLHCGMFDRAYATTWPESPSSPRAVGERCRTARYRSA